MLYDIRERSDLYRFVVIGFMGEIGSSQGFNKVGSVQIWKVFDGECSERFTLQLEQSLLVYPQA